MSDPDDRPGDDRDWLEALAGRSPAGGGGDAAFEAARLRAGILSRPVEEPEPVPVVDPRREAALIARARREGLIPERAARPSRAAGWRAALALAAAVAVVAVGLAIRRERPPEIVRGAPGGIFRLAAADPEATRREIVAGLAAAGVTATVYERLGRLGIDADLPAPPPPAIAALLEKHGIPAPADGALMVEIAPPGGP